MHIVTVNHVDYVVIGGSSKELINLAIDEFRLTRDQSIHTIRVKRVSNNSKVLKVKNPTF